MPLNYRDPTLAAIAALEPHAPVIEAFFHASRESDPIIQQLLNEERWHVNPPYSELKCWRLPLEEHYPTGGGVDVHVYCEGFRDINAAGFAAGFAAGYDFNTTVTNLNPAALEDAANNMHVNAISLAKMLAFHERVHAYLCNQQGHTALHMLDTFAETALDEKGALNRNYWALHEQIAMTFMLRADWSIFDIGIGDLAKYYVFVDSSADNNLYTDFSIRN